MTLFTNNPFEKMMIQKPNGRRDNAPPVPYPPGICFRLVLVVVLKFKIFKVGIALYILLRL